MRKVPRVIETKCPLIMFQNLRRIIANISQGEARILQAPDSDVSLHIPEGSKGLFTMRVHTDHTRFPGVIPDEECIISPLVEVEHKELTEEANDEEQPLYVLKIPHSLRHSAEYNTVRIRKGKIEAKSFQDLKVCIDYEIDYKFITIFTRKFSTFVCTNCENSCQSTVMLFLLGYLEPRQETNDTLAKIKSFICSDLYRIKDFRAVRKISILQCLI